MIGSAKILMDLKEKTSKKKLLTRQFKNPVLKKIACFF